jgi:asparagine N-glycosylation enzyme membrane subunit Stt3
MTFLKKYGWILIILLALVVAIILRVILPWGTVFSPTGIILQGVDGYYYERLADLISHNNMQTPQFDSYYDYPNGMDYSGLPTSFSAYGWFIALLTWIFTWGNPTKSALDFISVFHPAILGILALIPIFFITKKITKNNYVASGAMFLGAIMPGEYMGRAMLGSTDTHCLEIFLFSYIMMFTIYALNDGKWKILWIILSSLFATAYLLIWQGAVIYPLLLAIISICWLVWSRIKGKPDYELASTATSIIAFTTVLYLAFSYFSMGYIYMLFVPLVGMILMILYTFALQRVKNWVYLLPLGIVVIIGVVLVTSIKFVGYTFYPVWFTDAARQVYNLVAWHTQSVTSEELPLLITLGSVSTEIPWVYFALPWYLTFIGIGMMVYYWLKRNDMNLFILLVWTLVILLPTLAMRRFSYYFAFNVIIVGAWAIWIFLRYLWVRGETK